MNQVFQCSHCITWAGPFKTAEACLAHEAKCEYNKANKTCCTCRHFDFSSRAGQHEDWGHYEDDGEWTSDPGCLVFGDQHFRRGCEKWEAKCK